MSRVFLADTETYVEVPDGSWSLAKICEAFQVDSSSAYIRNSTTGTVVATRPNESLPEFSGNIEYILCAATSNNNNGTNNNIGNNNNSTTTRSSEEDEIQYAVLRMAQLVDSLGASDNNNNHDGMMLGNDDDEALIASFFRESDQISKNPKKVGSDSASSSLLEEVLKVTNTDLMQNKDHAMFVSSEEHYSPETLRNLTRQIASKKKNINANKYSFS